MTLLARLLRVIAIAIAVLGVVDPVMTWPSANRPVVAVIDAGDAAATAQIERELSRDFAVHRGAVANAAGSVLVGASLPSPAPSLSGAIIAAVPPPALRHVAIDRVVLPSRSVLGSRVPVGVTLHARGAKGRTLRVDASVDGVLLDRATSIVATDDESLEVALSAAALAQGATAVTLRVRDDANDDPALTAEAIAATEVVPARWNVLVIDPRPSWMSTFVRRTVEADKRFTVTSRVTTSRGIAAEVGNAPSLTDAAALDAFDTVIVGAPDALSVEDVRLLERFARGRGGAVVLLMDRVDTGAFARLTGAASWRDLHGVERRPLSAPAGVMFATELAAPEGLAPGVDALSTGTGPDKKPMPIVWSVPAGAGRVIVSGALDAWRYRTRESGGFSKFWTQAIADASSAAPAAVTVTPSVRVASPDAALEVRVAVRAVQLSDPLRPAPSVDVQATVAAVGSTGRAEPIRLWPTPERGVFATTVHLPRTAGMSHINVEATTADGAVMGGASADVLTGEARALNTREDLAAWTTANGGTVVASADAGAVARALHDRATPASAPPQVHPMRAWWWLPIFVGALGGEWWLRRRRGDR